MQGLAFYFRGLCPRVLAAGLLGCAAAAAAAPDPFAPGQTDFLVGTEAFHAGYYDAALESFLRARDAGFPAPTLRFNIALSYYKLEQYPKARAAFDELRGVPGFADVAEFHLGLVAAQLGQDNVAIAYLKDVIRTSPSPKLKLLARTALDRINGVSASSAPASSIYVSGGLGYDSNPVLLTDTSSVPGQGPDWFGEALGSYGYKLSSGASSSDQLRGSFYARQYHKDTDLSQQDLYLSYEHSLWGQKWRFDFGLVGETDFVGGQSLQSSGGPQLAVSERLGDTTLNLRYQIQRVAGASHSTYLDGWQQNAGLYWVAPLGRGRFRFDYSFEANDRRDINDGDVFFSESPTRHGVSARLEQPLGERLWLEGRIGYRYTRYRDADRFFVDNNPMAERRTENLSEFGATARYRILPGWNLLTQYGYSHNRANIPSFSYNRNQASLAVEWLGQ